MFGPRGTGKTWWAKQAYTNALHVDLLDPETVRRLGARPERLREMLAAAITAEAVVIDEVQKLPELLEVVHTEGLVRSVGTFARFLEAISFSHASVLNLANVARECEVSRKTAEGYLEILEDLLLGYRLPVFSRRAKRQLAAHPKFYFFDTGVFRANRPTGPLDEPGEIDGAALEGLVAQHLRAWCHYSPGRHQLSFWLTRSQVEVDFVIYGESGIHAVEVKNTGRIRPEHLRGLKAFGQDYPTAHLALLTRSRERLVIDGVSCLPIEDFLSGLRPGTPPLSTAGRTA